MGNGKKLHFIIAESSPLLSMGLVQCLRRIQHPKIDITETLSHRELSDYVKKNFVDLIIVNPTFGGIINPEKLREESVNTEIKIIALELGKLARAAASLYDETLNVTDDLETISNKIITLVSGQKESSEEKETLSGREKEIISLVVRGLTNQEIADKLFLSIHTVITHRKNIARKLEIHSATGLTIYAIANKIVNIEDITNVK